MEETYTKNWYVSKTIWLAILQSVGAVIMIWAKMYPEIGWLLILKSVIDVILRDMTYKPIK